MMGRRYAAPVIRRRLIVLVCSAALVASGWYATRAVRPDCTYAAFSFGAESPEAAAERAYKDAVAAGQCDPPRARWRLLFD